MENDQTTDGGIIRDVAEVPAMDLRFSFHFEQNDPLQSKLNGLETSANIEKIPMQRKMPSQPFTVVDNSHLNEQEKENEKNENEVVNEEAKAIANEAMIEEAKAIANEEMGENVKSDAFIDNDAVNKIDQEEAALITQAKEELNNAILINKEDDNKEERHECNTKSDEDQRNGLLGDLDSAENSTDEKHCSPMDQCAKDSKHDDESYLPVVQCTKWSKAEKDSFVVNACEAKSKEEKNSLTMDQCDAKEIDQCCDAKDNTEEKEPKSPDFKTIDDAASVESIAPPPVPSNPYTIANMYPVKWEDSLPAKPTVNTLKKSQSIKKPSAKPSQSSKTTPKPISLSQTAPAPRTKTHQKQINTIQVTHAAELTKLQVQLECITKERDCTVDRYHRANEEMHQMAQSLQSLQLQAAKFQAEAEAYKSQCTTLQTLVEKEQLANEESKKRASSYQSDMNQFKAKWSVGQGKISALEKEKAVLMSKLDISKQETHRVQANLDTATRRIQKLQAELTTQQTNHSSALSKWKQKKEMLLHENKAQSMRMEKELSHELQMKMKTMEVQTDKKLRDIEDSNQVLRRRNQQLESKLKDAHDQIRILELKTTAVKKQTMTKDSTKHLELEIQMLQRELAAFKQNEKHNKIVTTKAIIPPKQKDMINTASQVSFDPIENNTLQIAELENEINMLKDKLIAKDEHLMSLRELHTKELKLQAQAYKLDKENL
ncbi:hypothetical protein THRCLA_08824 [Thraustotheca clavata]|uniref:Uncharacterized protein n=1 Tax=Thraustotheca clavata TaxID=74557 RepID=A0A1V9Z1Z9_9STRA|nr:hypothetical protein THRCLA_08824 [Thraustotheca clavata]